MSALIAELEKLLDEDGLLTDESSCVLYSQDVFTKSIKALAVVRPSNKEALVSCIKAAKAAKVDVIPRGAGLSYTSGFVPENEGSIIIDLGRMNKVLEINTEDMFVTVEAGCTWEKLYKTLENTGYRTPFWGTLSGRFATIGGVVGFKPSYGSVSNQGSVACAKSMDHIGPITRSIRDLHLWLPILVNNEPQQPTGFDRLNIAIPTLDDDTVHCDEFISQQFKKVVADLQTRITLSKVSIQTNASQLRLSGLIAVELDIADELNDV